MIFLSFNARKRPLPGPLFCCLLRFFVCFVLLAPLAELGDLKTILEDLLVLMGHVVDPVASRALELNKIIL